MNVSPTYNQIHNACRTVASNLTLHGYKIERIVGLSRGGLLPGIILSHMMEVPFTPISYSSKNGKGDNRNHDNQLPVIKENIILFIDDIIDSARTMLEVTQHYDKQLKQTFSFSLYYKERTPEVYKPTFHWITIPEGFDEWITFPFENQTLINE